VAGTLFERGYRSPAAVERGCFRFEGHRQRRGSRACMERPEELWTGEAFLLPSPGPAVGGGFGARGGPGAHCGCGRSSERTQEEETRGRRAGGVVLAVTGGSAAFLARSPSAGSAWARRFSLPMLAGQSPWAALAQPAPLCPRTWRRAPRQTNTACKQVFSFKTKRPRGFPWHSEGWGWLKP